MRKDDVIEKYIVADAMAGLDLIQSCTVDMCVTSPPYFCLRDYGQDGQIGLETTPEEYIDRLVNVFWGVRRVLRDDGTLWVNIGDSYAGGGRGCDSPKQRSNRGTANMPHSVVPKRMKPKDLIGIPWMLAFALRADGWYLRQDIIWAKPNPMPESVTDRCTKSHEYIFLLSKSPRYYFDQKAVLEPVSPNTHMRISQDLANQIGSHRAHGGSKANGPMKAVSRKTEQGEIGVVKNNPSWDQSVCLPVLKRNKRSVWLVTKQSFSGAHFATFPPELIRPCILAGSRPGGIVLDPFFGSGTTGVVAKQEGRGFIGIDISREYMELAKRRIGGITRKGEDHGQEAKLQNDC